jgi:hypothetical protein
MRAAHLLFALVAALGLLASPAPAQDAGDNRSDVAGDRPAKEEQIQRIRQLPAEEKQRLKSALERFRALPAEKQQALRLKAREIGTARLGELTGRDVPKLRKRHEALQQELAEVWKLLGGPQRVASLTPDERTYMEAESLRGFQRHIRQRILEAAHFSPGDFETLPLAEKRDRLARGADAALEKILEEQPDVKTHYLTLSAPEQRRERARLMKEWRLRETVPFAQRFEGRLLKFMELPADKRQALVARGVRWLQIALLLHADGVAPETMQRLGSLRPDERAQVAMVYELNRDKPASDRRALVEQKIQELYGRGSLEDDRARQQRGARLQQILRARALRERGPVPVVPATTPK